MNKSIFTGRRTRVVPPPPTAVNNAGGAAYSLSAEEALATYAVTGTLGDTFYASAEDQLDKVLELARQCSPKFVAQVAIYARKNGKMKDMPAVLVAYLGAESRGNDAIKFGTHALWFENAFYGAIDNVKMLRNFVQAIRSGRFGSKGLGTRIKKQIQWRLKQWSDDQIFRGSVGNDPTLADVIRLAHPKPHNPARDALYRYIVGRPMTAERVNALPELVIDYEAFKAASLGKAGEFTEKLLHEIPKVPFEMLTALTLTAAQWRTIARQSGWHWLRMNLNTLARHGAFADLSFANEVANRLAKPDPDAFPYQIFNAYQHVDAGVPPGVRLALQDALDASLSHVPVLPGRTFVMLDVSGSMKDPVTGTRKGATTTMRNIDVAALFAAGLLRTNPGNTAIVSFNTQVTDGRKLNINPRDSLVTNTEKFVSALGGGTDCSAPLRFLNQLSEHGDRIIYLSDNESWAGPKTGQMQEWLKFKARNPQAKMICINISPPDAVQVTGVKDVINVAGFNDSVFELLSAFSETGDVNTWVQRIREVQF